MNSNKLWCDTEPNIPRKAFNIIKTMCFSRKISCTLSIISKVSHYLQIFGSSMVEHLLMVQWVVRSILHGRPFERFLFPAKGHVYGVMHIKDPWKSSPWMAAADFLSLSWRYFSYHITVNKMLMSVVLNKTFPSKYFGDKQLWSLFCSFVDFRCSFVMFHAVYKSFLQTMGHTCTL